MHIDTTIESSTNWPAQICSVCVCCWKEKSQIPQNLRRALVWALIPSLNLLLPFQRCQVRWQSDVHSTCGLTVKDKVFHYTWIYIGNQGPFPPCHVYHSGRQHHSLVPMVTGEGRGLEKYYRNCSAPWALSSTLGDVQWSWESVTSLDEPSCGLASVGVQGILGKDNW